MTPEELADLLPQSLAELDGRESLPQHVWIAALNRVNDQAREAGLESDELRFELFAAEVTLNDAPAEWGTLFGPTMTMLRADQTRLDVPPLLGIDAAAVDYWTRRMEEATHPLMRARYADLVWDLSQTVANRRPPVRAAQLAIDSYVDTVADERCEMHDGYGDYMRRPIALAALTNDQARLAAAVVRFEGYAAVAEDEERAFRQLKLLNILTDLLRPARRPPEAMQRLIDSLRARFDALAAVGSGHFTLERLALPLAYFYKENDQLDQARAVLRVYGAAVFPIADQAMALLGIAWLRQLHRHYESFDMAADAMTVLARIEARQSEVPGNLVRVQIPMEVDAGELEEFLNVVVTRDLAYSAKQIVFSFLPNLEEQLQQMAELAADHPLAAMFGGAVLVADDGREIARLGADEKGRLIHHLTQGYQGISFHLRQAFARLRERYAPDASVLFDHCAASAVWPADRHGILRRGIEAYFDNDHVVAIHLLVTEIENAVRNVARLAGAPVQQLNNLDGFDLRTLGDLLAREPQLKACLSDGIALYMESVLTDRRGWNLRNTTCHGIRPFAAFDSVASERLMHVVLLLSLLRPLADGEPMPAEAAPEDVRGDDHAETPAAEDGDEAN